MLIAPASKPPVARIADYGKLRYELQKKEKEGRKTSKGGITKEIKLSPKIAQHDFDVRAEKTKELLSKGFKVKVNIMFRGREMAHKDLGHKLLERFVEVLGEAAKVEAPPKMEGRNLNMMLGSKK